MRAAKTDHNQAAIVNVFRQAGCKVQDLHAVGRGCPDLLLSWKWRWWVVEVKSKRGTLTPDQIVWHRTFTAPVAIIRTCMEAIDFIKDPEGFIKKQRELCK